MDSHGIHGEFIIFSAVPQKKCRTADYPCWRTVAEGIRSPTGHWEPYQTPRMARHAGAGTASRRQAIPGVPGSRRIRTRYVRHDAPSFNKRFGETGGIVNGRQCWFPEYPGAVVTGFKSGPLGMYRRGPKGVRGSQSPAGFRPFFPVKRGPPEAGPAAARRKGTDSSTPLRFARNDKV